MCGIAGFIDWQGTEGAAPIIKKMTQTLARRGPDGADTWVGSYAAFGHRRLSIIDLAGGAQPMVVLGKNGKPLTLTYNGELYNYLDVRRKLRSRGHQFVTNSDTEVILRAYDEWGIDCVHHFTGIFAFGLWDDAKRQLFMARDQLGVKPLYYYQTPRGIVFGSEEKALLTHPDVPAALDHTGLAELFCMVPMTNPDGAIFKGMGQLRPGHRMVVNQNSMRKSCYWKLEAVPHTDNEATTVQKLRELFEKSIEGQLMSDVPLGAILSGGVDSSAVAAVAAKFYRDQGKQLPTFDIDYDSANTSYAASALHVDRDAPWAKKVAEFIGTNHSTHFVAVPDLYEAQQTVLDAWGRPTYSPVNVSLHLLFKYIRSTGVRVVLGGEGADEAVAGYRWWRDPEDVDYDGYPWHRTYREASYLLRPEQRKLINPAAYIRDSYTAAVAEIPVLEGEDKHETRMRRISWLTYMYYLNFLLHRVDRMSMAAGVEARVPFCDHHFTQYAWNIPWDMKNTGGMEKGILRKAVEDLLPHDVAWRRKSGYPVAQMEEYQQAIWNSMRFLLTRDEPLWSIVDRKAVQRIIDEEEGNIAEWTWLNHISYLLEMNTWWKQWDIKLQ